MRGKKIWGIGRLTYSIISLSRPSTHHVSFIFFSVLSFPFLSRNFNFFTPLVFPSRLPFTSFFCQCSFFLPYPLPPSFSVFALPFIPFICSVLLPFLHLPLQNKFNSIFFLLGFQEARRHQNTICILVSNPTCFQSAILVTTSTFPNWEPCGFKIHRKTNYRKI